MSNHQHPKRPGALSRRSLLGTAGAAAAAVAVPGLVRPAPARAARRASGLSKIEHIVYFIQENRSFDHYFGTLRGVRGFGDAHALKLPGGKSVFQQPDPSRSEGHLLPFHLDTFKTSGMNRQDVPHGWTDSHDAWNHGAMDQWVKAKGQWTMGYYDRKDMPFYYGLADAFTICDNYYCSVMSSTNPNRLYTTTGMIDPQGRNRGPAWNNHEEFLSDNPNAKPFNWTTYPERLTKAGVTWRNYQSYDNYDDDPMIWFEQFQRATPGSTLFESDRGRITGFDSFIEDVRNDALPNVSWIVPGEIFSEHPEWPPVFGGLILQRFLAALAANPRVWKKTAIVWTMDEAGGFFDHVAPPVPRAGTADEFIDIGQGRGLEPIGAGTRVPTLLISPYSAGGFVASQAYDHTSLIRLMEDRFGVEEPNISQWRRDTFGSLAGAFDFSEDAAMIPHLPPNEPDVIRQLEAFQMKPIAEPEQRMPRQEPGERHRRN